MAMTPMIPRSKSRKVNGYVKAALALEAARKKRVERYDRFVRPLDRKRDQLAAEVATRLRALSGGQLASAQRLLAATKGERLALAVSAETSALAYFDPIDSGDGAAENRGGDAEKWA